MRNAFLFPGQGAQKIGMIKDIYDSRESASKLVDEISELSGKDLKKLMWQASQDELNRSDNCQIAILTSSLVIMKILSENGIKADAAMGFSLGEYAALHAAGIVGFEDIVHLVTKRGIIMQEVCDKIAAENEGKAPGMSAILGLKADEVKNAIKGINDVYAANLNSDRQTVISGTFDALGKAEEALKAAGAKRCIRLKVAGPYHSPLMKEAGERFKEELDKVKFSDPVIPFLCNVTGDVVTTAVDAKDAALKHFTNSVLWTREEENLASIMVKDGEWQILEVGVGSVLSGLWKQCEFSAKWEAKSVNDEKSLTEVIQ